MDNTLKVAFADDHTLVRKTVTGFLHGFGGIEVCIEADSGEELLEKLKSAEVLPDVCILDISMEKLTGYEILPILKETWPNLKVLVLSAFFDEGTVLRMAKLGANGFLPKNCDPEEIKTGLCSIHETGIYYSGLFSLRSIIDIQKKNVKVPAFSEKELEYLKRCCSDLSHPEIALQMGTTTRSIDGYRDNLFRKIGVNSRVMLALYAVETGLVPQGHFRGTD